MTKKGLNTDNLHSDRADEPEHGVLHKPVHTSVAYGYDKAKHLAEVFQGKRQGYNYGRQLNPTVTALQKRITKMEAGLSSVGFSTGMAAISSTMLALLKTGDHVISSSFLFGNTNSFFETLKRLGIEVSFVDATQAKFVEEAVRENTKIVFTETIANPVTQVADLVGIGQVCKDKNLVYIVDNTMTSPFSFKPKNVGASLIINSLTKYIGGHSDLIAGAASGKTDAVARIREYRHFLGGMADPNTCWMLMRSMETLAIRVRHQQDVAEQVFAHVRNHPKVQRFISAWPVDLPDGEKAIAEEQMLGGGAMAAFEVAGGRAGAFRVLNALKHFQLAVSLGSTESLAEHPASMTHAGVPPEVKAQYGISEGLIRISVGIERPEDLIADLDQAFAQV